MNVRAYVADRAWAIACTFVCALGVAGMFAALGASVAAALSAGGFVLAIAAAVLVVGYARYRWFYRELAAILNSDEPAYLASELIDEPAFLEGRLAHRALAEAGRAAADDVARYRSQAQEYRDYIELWIHEIKTPIAAAGLMTAGVHGDQAERLRGELDRIEACVEQALYYARSTSLSCDYAIREVPLAAVVRDALRKHARFLIEKGMAPVVDVPESVTVLADAKWLSFMVGQIASNSAKYGAHTLTFSAREQAGDAGRCTVLEAADDGCGIPAADVPRVFDRGFTGSNGRRIGSSTGMGLYLVAELCAKMGLAVAIASEEGTGTRVMLSFPCDRRRLDAGS